MTDYILILGFGDDTYEIEKTISKSLEDQSRKIQPIAFHAKWELRNWLDEHARVIIHTDPFRHDSRVFYNSDMFCNKEDYEQTFIWNKYHSEHIKALIISSCSRELDPPKADIVYDNLDFAKNILPGIPKIILDFTDGQWCAFQEHEFVNLVREHQQSVYFLKRDISSEDARNASDFRVSQFVSRLIKSNFDLMLETYLAIRSS